MLSQTLFTTVFALASTALAAPLDGRKAEICYSTETAALTCYAGNNGTPQNVTVADIQYVASYLRAYGQQTRAGRLFTMSAADATDCAEWTLYQHGSVLATAKHIKTKLNSSVLFTDIANTIDGGASATAAQQAKAIIGCKTNGGSYGVQYNASNPAYHATTYPAGYTPDGILIKITNTGA